MRFLAPLLFTLVTPVALAHAESAGPAAAVRGYFDALGRQDFGRALAMTDGAAQTRTSQMVDQLKTEAAAHHARVDVKITHLDVRAPGEPDARGLPVPVAFHIDVVGHRWCFSKVARALDGVARFYFDPQRPDRIVAIEGRIVD
jgi:hypothetical protein